MLNRRSFITKATALLAGLGLAGRAAIFQTATFACEPGILVTGGTYSMIIEGRQTRPLRFDATTEEAQAAVDEIYGERSPIVVVA